MDSIKILKMRDVLMQSIRAFFHSEGFIEVETPIRMKTPCMELHIDAEPSGSRWLRTSPELYHKKLLAQGADKIFEIGKCFRHGERGDLHHPEYTLLEWYRAGGDYTAMLADVAKILRAVGISTAWKRWTVAETYEKFAGWNPVENVDADRFDLDMVEKIEPALPKDAPVILMDYPAECCALARLKPDNPTVAERWELYLNGIEIANAYSELTDPAEQRARFGKWGEQRKTLGKTVYPIDEEFIRCLEKMPPAGGCALGIDRLFMVLIGAESLDDILPFRD
ncbi:MAG: elongation factor P--(R)-beta-lysine ligase [Verrucomicrobiota bacterium]|jgi:lysyl-tRNA synthetase class 2|nr:elongation factor P--(R)-beta-lysine ligase [Verrucomicrobiota bacterium]MDK2963996.1 elongation factor P--(R)-beta-lysine ligase [Verrucomicrobiota bacterium]